jgi:putative redox protein
MSFQYSVQRTKGVLDRMRADIAKRAPGGGGKFVKLHAKVNFVDGHLMTVDIRHGAYRIVTDEPSQYGGHDVAPAPLEFFVAGFALCEAAQYLWQIADMELDIDDIALEVKTANSWSPVLPEGTDETPELSRITLRVWIESSEPRERIEELVRRAARHCPAHNALEKPLTIKTDLHLNEGLPGAPKPNEAEEIYSPEAA